jgi:hypothetical protein
MCHKLLIAMAERLREADKKEVMHNTRLA